MNRTIVKTREAYDFLALVPQLVGFQPERSMVLVAFRGNRTCGAMRFNLPAAGASRTVLRRIASTLVGTLCRIPGVDAVVPVVYTEETFASVAGLPAERFAETVCARAELSGFLVRDALCVAPDVGYLACDRVGAGRLPTPEVIVGAVEKLLGPGPGRAFPAAKA